MEGSNKLLYKILNLLVALKYYLVVKKGSLVKTFPSILCKCYPNNTI